MEELKPIFDTLIVGLFAFPVAILVIHVVVSFYFVVRRVHGVDVLDYSVRAFLRLNDGASGAGIVPGMAVLAMAYILGAAVFNLADRYFDKSLAGVWQTDDEIKVATYLEIYAIGRGEAEPVQRAAGVELRDELTADYFPPFLSKDVTLLRTAVEQNLDVIKEKRYGFDGTFASERALRESVLSIYNHQKFYNYTHSQTGHDILRELYHQIVMLRGVAFDSLLTFLVACAALAVDTFRRMPLLASDQERIAAWRRRLTRYVPILGLSLAMWWIGSWGWSHLEREYDENTIGIYHGQVDSGPVSNPWIQAPPRRENSEALITNESPLR